jgi:small GTP-binding protein
MTENIINENKQIECQICLLGYTFVGKTSIINRFIFNKFNENELSTSLPKYLNKDIITPSGYLIRIQFWDTAGQEKYRSIANMVYKRSDIIILTYSIDNKKSFEEIKNFWYNEVVNKTDSPSKNIFLIYSFRFNW